MDTGSQVTLLSYNIFSGLNPKPNLKKSNVNLTSANGSSLIVRGSSFIPFKAEEHTFKHTFIIVENLSRSVILGRDFLFKNNAIIYTNLKKIKIRDLYIPLVLDAHIALITRTRKPVTLQPRTDNILQIEIERLNQDNPNSSYIFSPKLSSSFFQSNKGLRVSESLININDGVSHVQMINETDRPIFLKKGLTLGQAEVLNNEVAFVSDRHRKLNNVTFNNDLTDAEFLNFAKRNDNFKKEIDAMLLRNREVFAFNDYELETTDLATAEINTGDAAPVNLRPYRTPLAQRDALGEEIDNLLDAGILQHSSSAWNFPCLLIPKKQIDSNDKKPKYRLVVDMRRLNSLCLLESVKLPHIDDIFALLNGARYFTTVDLRAGFHQIPLSHEAQQKCSFSCHKGKFSYRVLPYGLKNAPNIFSDVVTRLLKGLEGFALAYIDDILIFSCGDINDHINKVEQVLNRLKEHKLKLKLEKCYWAQTSVQYLGFIITRDGIKPVDDKIKAIRSLKPPTSVKLARSYLGCIGWYRRFIPRFAEIAGPIVDLTKKHARFRWSEACEKAFKELNKSLTLIPLLGYPDREKPYKIYCDSSSYSIGVHMSQSSIENALVPNSGDEVPIFFLSHRLTTSQIKGFSTTEKECYAILFALTKLNFYIYNCRVIVFTDHKPLKFLFSAPLTNKRLERWAIQISQYNVSIQYLKGKDQKIADYLSRCALESNTEDIINNTNKDNTVDVNVINTNIFDTRDFLKFNEEALEDLDIYDHPVMTFDMAHEQIKDRNVRIIKDKLINGKADNRTIKRFIIKDNVLLYISDPDDNPRLRIYIPEHLQNDLLTQFHTNSGHFGSLKTYKTISQKYYCPNLFKIVNSFVEACIPCKERNLKAKLTPIQEVAFPSGPMRHIQLDLAGPYQKSISGNQYICTIIDLYSGWVEAKAIPDKSAETVVECLFDLIITRHGVPIAITSDNGKETNNKIFQDTLKHLNIIHIKTSIYHPESDGSIERHHRTINDLLSKLQKDKPELWDIHLNEVLFALRSHVNLSTGISPFEALYSREILLPLDSLLRIRQKTYSTEYHTNVLENYHKAFVNLMKYSRKSMKNRNQKANKKRCPHNFKVGDKCFLRNFAKRNKLDKNWLPYHIIVKSNGPSSFVVRNQLTQKLSRVHANALRLANVDWRVPPLEGKPVRRTQLAVSPPSSEDDDADSEGESDETEIYDLKSYEERLGKSNRVVREDSDSENSLPEFEIKRQSRIRHLSNIKPKNNANDDNVKTNEDDENTSPREESPMEIDEN